MLSKIPYITPFQNSIYSLLKKIPRGKITTYKVMAEKLGIKAYRAVGLACKKNPYAPEIPCHRVVCSDGKLGGYSGIGGLAGKIKLLENEGVKIRKNKIENFERVLWKGLL